MSFYCEDFNENQIVVGQPVLSLDTVVELYQNDNYIATISIDHVLETLQDIMDGDLNDDVSIEENGAEWIKCQSLRIAAAGLRQYLELVEDKED